MTDIDKLIAELNRRAKLPSGVPERAFLVGIRYLLSESAAALAAQQAKITEALDFVDVTDRDGWWNVSKIRRILSAPAVPTETEKEN